MAQRTFGVGGQTAQWEPEDVAAYLDGKGYVIGPGGVGADLAPNDPTTVVVSGDFDPHVPDATIQADLDAFVPPTNQLAAAQVAYRQAIRDLRATDQTTTAAQYVAIFKRCHLAAAGLRGV